MRSNRRVQVHPLPETKYLSLPVTSEKDTSIPKLCISAINNSQTCGSEDSAHSLCMHDAASQRAVGDFSVSDNMKAAVDLATKALPHHGSACRSNMQVFRVPPPYHSNEEALRPLVMRMSGGLQSVRSVGSYLFRDIRNAPVEA
mmetsp:Transcript_63254/g.131608  ORF Transcript_63254/g.131608 Transcript_63254/m.131608 type:complete len:144 (-) Transcript_63254:7-438(-)